MTKRTCKIEDCGGPPRALGMCMKHYDQERRAAPAPVCKVEGCKKKSATRGMCPKHYARWRKYGDTETVALVHNDVDRRFRESYKVTASGCWEWQGHIEANGYARFTIGQDRWLSHRWAYERFVGPIPTGLVIDHLCRNRRCVNPNHLEAVTARTNILRGESIPAQNAVKTHCKRGHPLSGQNVSIQKDGSRRCLACHSIRQKRSRARKSNNSIV